MSTAPLPPKSIHPSYVEIWRSLPEIQAAVDAAGLGPAAERLVEMLMRRVEHEDAAGGREYATVVVAASNSHEDGKLRANFVCDGDDDGDTISQAFASLPQDPDSGLYFGRVELLEGTYTGGTLSFPGSVTGLLQGQGGGGFVSTTNLEMDVDLGTGLAIFGFRDLSIQGNVTYSGTAYLLARDVAVFGTTDATNLFAWDSVFQGAVTASSSVEMKGSTLSGGITCEGLDALDSRSFGAMTVNGSLILRDFWFACPIIASENIGVGGIDLDIDGLYQWDAVGYVDLTGYERGRVINVTLRNGNLTDRPLLKLTDTLNVEVRGRFAGMPFGSSQPQVLLTTAGGTCRNNAVIGAVFVGNAEEPEFGTAGTEYHVQIDSGVETTKLAYCYFGGADSGDYLDNGTGTVILPDPSAPTTDVSNSDAFWMIGGPPGADGRTGATGATGAAGATGPAGADADPALLWLLGAPGPKGDTGATGATGAAGSSGDETLGWMLGGDAKIETPTVRFKSATRTGGNVTFGTSAFNVDTGLDLVLPANVGDVIEYGISGRYNAASGSDATMDVFTLVSGSPVNAFGNALGAAGRGVPSWYGPNTATGLSLPCTGSVFKTMVSGDLSGGTVTLRLRGLGAGGGAVTLNASATTSFYVWARNLGPAA